jgi:hypothetical protein
MAKFLYFISFLQKFMSEFAKMFLQTFYDYFSGNGGLSKRSVLHCNDYQHYKALLPQDQDKYLLFAPFSYNFNEQSIS